GLSPCYGPRILPPARNGPPGPSAPPDQRLAGLPSTTARGRKRRTPPAPEAGRGGRRGRRRGPPSPPGVTCRTVSRGAAGRAGPAPAVRPRDHFAPAVARSPAGPLAPFLRKPMSSYTGERKPKEPALTRFLRAAVSWGRW